MDHLEVSAFIRRFFRLVLGLWLGGGFVYVASWVLAASAHAYGTVPESGSVNIDECRVQVEPPNAIFGDWVTGGFPCPAGNASAIAAAQAATGIGRLGCSDGSYVQASITAYDNSNFQRQRAACPGGSAPPPDFLARSVAYRTRVDPTCPSGSTKFDGKCLCPSGKEPSAGTCVDIPNCRDRVNDVFYGGGLQYMATTSMDIRQCYRGCDVMCEFTATAGSGIVCSRPQATGKNCEGAPDPSGGNSGKTGEPRPDPPPAGKCPGTVNGVSVLVPCSNSNTGRDQTKSNSDGTTTETQKRTNCDVSGCTTTTTTTTKDASGNTTGTVVNVSQGSDTNDPNRPGGSGRPSGGLGGTCTGSNCGSGGDSSWGGTCAAGFSCSGDAVQCAMAQDQHTRHCQTLEPVSAADPIAQAASAGDRPSDHPYNTGTTVNMGTAGGTGPFDQTDLIGGGACPAPITFTMGGQSVSIPFTRVCENATWLGNLLVAFTSLACLGIVFIRGS